MAYAKTTWNPGIAPGISAANLNNLETQYDEAMADLTFHTRSTTLADITVVAPGNAALGASTWEAILDVSGGGPYYLIGGFANGDNTQIDALRYTIDGAGPTSIAPPGIWYGSTGSFGILIPCYAATSLKIEIHNGDGANPHGYVAQILYRT